MSFPRPFRGTYGRTMRRTWRGKTGLLVALGWLVLARAIATESEATPRATSTERVAIIGASLSHGFGAPPGWTAAVTASRTRPPEHVAQHTSLFFFTHPFERGKALVSRAKAFRPTLVLAIDFLFWFGYGNLDAAGSRFTAEADRLRLLARGQSLLEEFECPVVVGDFPDMSAAIGWILAAEQVPQPETRAALNERLHAWAASRTNIVVVPLDQWIARIQTGQPIRIGELEFDGDSTARWLQGDRLHPTPHGLIALALLANDRLVQLGFLEPEAALTSIPEIRRRMELVPGEDRDPPP